MCRNWQINLTLGIFPELGAKIKSKQERYGRYRDRSLTDLANWKANHN